MTRFLLIAILLVSQLPLCEAHEDIAKRAEAAIEKADARLRETGVTQKGTARHMTYRGFTYGFGFGDSSGIRAVSLKQSDVGAATAAAKAKEEARRLKADEQARKAGEIESAAHRVISVTADDGPDGAVVRVSSAAAADICVQLFEGTAVCPSERSKATLEQIPRSARPIPVSTSLYLEIALERESFLKEFETKCGMIEVLREGGSGGSDCPRIQRHLNRIEALEEQIRREEKFKEVVLGELKALNWIVVPR